MKNKIKKFSTMKGSQCVVVTATSKKEAAKKLGVSISKVYVY